MRSSSWWPTSDGPPPRHATRRNPDAYTDGPQVAAVASALGTPLTPWQRYVADVAGERRDDGSYEYQIVVVTVPRQSGKTTLIRAVATLRAMLGRGVFYTAQTGKDARARWMDLVKVLRLSPAFKAKMKSGEIKVALRGGSEHVEFPGGGLVQCFAPTVESLHGYTPATVFIDEAFAQEQENGDLLIGAIEPAQRVVVDKQLWLVSTLGTDKSTWFHDWLERAVAGIPRVAVFDWGARDDQDPFDLDDIADFHPAVGQEYREIGEAEGMVTAAVDILAAADRMSTAEYIRAYGNRKTRTAGGLVAVKEWHDLGIDELELPADRRDITLAVDVDEHQVAAALVAIWDEPATGKPVAKIVRTEPGTDWLVDTAADLVADWRLAGVVAFGPGPGDDLLEQLRDRGVSVDVLDPRECSAATTALIAGVRDRTFGHDGHPVLEAAATGLVTRFSGDGVVFSRRHSAGNTAAAIALVAGLYRHRHQPATAPRVRFG